MNAANEVPAEAQTTAPLVRVAALAATVVQFVVRTAAMFFVSGAIIWLLWLRPSTLSILNLAGSVTVLLLLLSPGVVYFVFARVLRQLVEVPGTLGKQATEGKRRALDVVRTVSSRSETEHITTSGGSHIEPGAAGASPTNAIDDAVPTPPATRSRILRFVDLLRALYGLGRSGIDAKGAVLGAVGAIRLFSPVVLVAIAAAGLAGILLCFVAAFGLLFRLL